MCAESTHAVSSFQTASIRSLRPSEILVLSPATQRRKPILPIRFRKPTRPRRNQKARRQHRDLGIRLRPVRPPPLQRTPRQTRLDEYRPETHPLCLGRNAIASGVHLQRQLHLSLHRPRQLRTLSPSLPQQPRRRAIPRLFPQRPHRHPARDGRHPRQSLMVRRIHRLGSSEKGRACLSERPSAVQTAKPIL